MTKRRRFTADFKARVALDALRGDRTVQEIAAKHKVHPNQVSTWKRQAVDGLGADHECRRGIVPSRQFNWDLHLRQTRSPSHELTNGLRHFKQRRGLAS